MSIKEEYTTIDMATAAADGFRDGQRAAQSAPVGERDDEREAFEAVVRLNWASAPLHYVRDALPKDDPRYGQYVDETMQGMWVGWQGRAAWQRTQSAGVPEGYALVPIDPTPKMLVAYMGTDGAVKRWKAMVAAAKAEGAHV